MCNVKLKYYIGRITDSSYWRMKGHHSIDSDYRGNDIFIFNGKKVSIHEYQKMCRFYQDESIY